MSDLREQGIAAAKAGRRDEARTLLAQALQHDKRDEHAWLWLAGVLDDPAAIRRCLNQALALNPHSEQARRGLRWLDSRVEAHDASDANQPSTALQTTTALEASQPDTLAQLETIVEAAPILPAPPPLQPVPVPAPTPYVPEMPFATPETIDQPSLLLPCPYCGAPTFMTRERCPKCGKSLMVRGAVKGERSGATTLLGVLWIINGLLVLILGVLALGSAMLMAMMLSSVVRSSGSSSLTLLLPFIIILAVGGGQLYVARGLFRRERWAYYAVIAGSVLISLGILYNMARGFVLGRTVMVSLGPTSTRLQTLSSLAVVLTVLGLIFQIVYFVLVWRSHGDFFGEHQRLMFAVEPNDKAPMHYDKGVEYQRVGKWYAAAQEWESAVKKAPTDIKYLHALGLAYARLKRPDEARATLDQAIALAPDDQRLHESRALVDKVMGE